MQHTVVLTPIVNQAVSPTLTQVAAGFSCGSAIAVLTGGRLFCRMTAAGRRNLCIALSLGTIAVFSALLTPGLPTYAIVGLLCWCILRQSWGLSRV